MRGIAENRTFQLEGYYYNGAVDDVRLYDRAFNASEIAQMVYILSAQPDRNYTGEDAVAICTLDIASTSGFGGNYYLVAKDAQGITLGTNSAPGVETSLVFTTAALPAGTNTITVELRRKFRRIAALLPDGHPCAKSPFRRR